VTAPRRPPRTGDVTLADLEPVRGAEQGRRRPVVVFQADRLRRFTRTLLCVPPTTNARRLGVPGTCFVRRGDGGLPEDSIALAFQIRALDESRLGRRLGTVAPDTVEALAGAVLAALGITLEP
jgi:mRNA interferase MazF